MKSKLFLASVAAMLLVPAIVAPVQANEMKVTASQDVSLFKDIPTSHYAYTAITNLAKKDVIKGFTDGTFQPTKQVTRAEFASFVARSLELPAADSSFKDVSKSMALYDGISRASKAGIILGFKDGAFKPNTPVSREDMAVILDRAMQIKGKYTQTKALAFADKNSIGAYAQESVKRMNYYNIMGAHSGTNFSGKAIGNRAETAKSIYNMLAAIDGVVIEKPKPTPPPSSGNTDGVQKPAKLPAGATVAFDNGLTQEYSYSRNLPDGGKITSVSATRSTITVKGTDKDGVRILFQYAYKTNSTSYLMSNPSISSDSMPILYEIAYMFADAYGF